MLIVYSAHGSPGASTTAMYLAAQWASAGTEVLLVEADPAGGSLSHHLGIQFTPGLASFVASGLEVRGGNLIDHSQDVLFNNLHVMPATSSPTGARQIVQWLDDRAEEFRRVAEGEMAVIVDGGRIAADSTAAELADCAAALLVVAKGDSSPTSLEHIGGLLSAETCGEGVERCVVTVGDSPLSTEEWRERCDITFCGAIKEFDEVRGDLAAFLNRNKRKSKKWRLSLEEVAEALLPYAKPPAGGRSRARRGETEESAAGVPEAEPASTASPDSAESAPSATESQELSHGDTGERHADHEAVEQGAYGEVPGAAGYSEEPQHDFDPYYGSTGGEYGEGPPPQPYSYPAPAAGYAQPPPGHDRQPLEQQPVYFETPPAPPEPAYYDAPLPVYDPQAQPKHPYEPQEYPPQPAASQNAPQGYPPQPAAPQHALGGYPPPSAPHQASHGYQQPAHGRAPAYQRPPAPPPPTHEPQPSPYQHAPQPQHPGHQPPHPAGHALQPEPPVELEIAPSGSFRDWAARLHAQAPQGTSTQGHGGVS